MTTEHVPAVRKAGRSWFAITIMVTKRGNLKHYPTMVPHKKRDAAMAEAVAACDKLNAQIGVYKHG